MKRIGLVFLCLGIVVAMTACAANATPTPSPTIMPSASPLTPTMMPGATDLLPGVSPSPTDNAAATTAAMTSAESAALSKKANDAAAKISEIDSCVTAIIGDTCMAGVTFDAQYKGELTDRIVDMVTSRIQSVAPAVERVAVTVDPAIAAQIGSVAEKISKTSTLGDMTGEFDTVLNKITY